MLLVPEVDKPTLAVLKPETDHIGLILRGLIPTPTSLRERKEDPIESRKLEREMGEGTWREGKGRDREGGRALWGTAEMSGESKEERASQ